MDNVSWDHCVKGKDNNVVFGGRLLHCKALCSSFYRLAHIRRSYELILSTDLLGLDGTYLRADACKCYLESQSHADCYC